MTDVPQSGHLPRIAVICGDDGVRAGVFDHDPSRIIPLVGNNDSRLLLDASGCSWARFHLTPNYFKRSLRWRFDRFDMIWNTISDVDLNPRTLAAAEKVVTQAGLPVVNRPVQVHRTARNENARRLQGVRGLVVPRTTRWRGPGTARIERQIRDGELRLPLIIRRTGSHTGEVVGVFDSIGSLTSLSGERRGEFYATEFFDYRSEDRLYRKWRFFFIGEKILLRHVLIADHWKINAEIGVAFMEGRENLRAEERGYFEAGFDGLPAPAKAALVAIRQRVGLDYFGIDCSILAGGELLLFETNATMNFLPVSASPVFDYKRGIIGHAACAVRQLVQRRGCVLRTPSPASVGWTAG